MEGKPSPWWVLFAAVAWKQRQLRTTAIVASKNAAKEVRRVPFSHAAPVAGSNIVFGCQIAWSSPQQYPIDVRGKPQWRHKCRDRGDYVPVAFSHHRWVVGCEVSVGPMTSGVTGVATKTDWRLLEDSSGGDVNRTVVPSRGQAYTIADEITTLPNVSTTSTLHFRNGVHGLPRNL